MSASHPAVRPAAQKTVLVVDDDSAMRRALVETLRGAGYVASAAVDGAAALRQLATTPVDLVIVDIFMPERDGFDVIAAIRRKAQPIPVLAISGGGVGTKADEALHQAELLGARAVLAKPFEPPAFLEAVARVLALG